MNESEQAQAIATSKALHEWLTVDFRASGAPFIHENHAFELYHAHADLLEIVDSQAQKLAELESLLGSSKSLCSIACDRFEQAKQEATKYRNAYVETAAPIYRHHPKSLMQASLLPWEKQ